ncbi:DUF7470 family protein [Haloarcula brevis]|uniref:DUF7470 family protein n=1 Tax=Haloarcula brevis TaxID=3111453 RepID=UPI00300E908D
MLDKLGAVGIAGIVVLLAGIGLVAWKAPVVAAGIALVVGGLGLVVYGLVTTLLGAFGLGGGMGGGMGGGGMP